MQDRPPTNIRTHTVALVGNPNVGKSTLFNTLTHLHQHTGNWSGKTVDSAQGSYIYQDTRYTLVDLPGTYSLHPNSAEVQFSEITPAQSVRCGGGCHTGLSMHGHRRCHGSCRRCHLSGTKSGTGTTGDVAYLACRRLYQLDGRGA